MSLKKWSLDQWRSFGRRLWQDWLSPLTFAVLLTQFGATAVRVDGVSMLPGLRHGEVLAIPKAEGWAHAVGWGTYHRGDIVVFKPPADALSEWKNDYHGLTLPWNYRPYLVKRVIGVPGDQVQVVGGTLLVNGKPAQEPQTLNYWNRFCHDTGSDLANTAPLTVPAGSYFVMGDNRSPGGSLDSRVFGPVKQHDIAGRAVASLWPLARKTQAIPGCDGEAHPEQRIRYEGGIQFNPRWLPSQHR